MTAARVTNLDVPDPRHTRRVRHNDLVCGIQRWKATGYGIDPNQPALRHRPHRGDRSCECHWCAGTPIVSTEPVRWPE